MWFATLDGKQPPLGISDPAQQAVAEAVYRRLLADLAAVAPAPPPQSPRPAEVTQPPQPAQPAPAARTVAAAAADFLARRAPPKISAECHRQYTITLATHLVPAFGPRPVASLTAEELEDWADRPAWSSSTRNNNLETVQTFLKWCKCPVSLRRPPKESRGGEAFVSDERFAEVLGAAVRGEYAGDLRDLLRLLRETGARPQEAARLTAEAVDWANGCVRLREHKTRRHGSERVIHFNSRAVAILEAQRARYPAGGFLFRTRYGNPYTGPAIVKRMASLSDRLGYRVIAYGQRHSFATKALVAGVPDAVVAELLGHTGTAMVAKHYGHLASQSRVLKRAVEQVSEYRGPS